MNPLALFTPLAPLLLPAALLACGLALLPLGLTLANLRLYRRAPQPPTPPTAHHAPHAQAPRVFVCVPARNEEANLADCVRSILADPDDPALRVLIYDDGSTDRTAAIAADLARADGRVRPVPSHPLPEGWNGKQHACWRMARAAIEGAAGDPEPALPSDLLLFTDADVRFEPHAARRADARRRELAAPMVSAFPRQLTGSLAEAAMVPMMFYMLLGYLPMARMRGTNSPAASAGCGQFLLLTVEAYERSGGHRAFRDSMHDGIMMPRAVRRAGMTTDLVDGTDLARVRMYRGLAQTWRGFAKNLYEGLGSPALLIFLTLVHLLGHLLPWPGLALALVAQPPRHAAAGLFAAAIALALTQRLLLALRLRHSVAGALLHPLGVLMMTAIQWHSYALYRTGRRAWRGRVLRPGAGLG